MHGGGMLRVLALQLSPDAADLKHANESCSTLEGM